MLLNSSQRDRKEFLIKAIKSIEKAQLDGITSGLSMSFNGRSMQRYTLDELEKIRLMFNAELQKLIRIEKNKSSSRTVRVIM